MNKVVKELIALICILGVIAISPALAQNEQKGFSFQGYARDFSGAAFSSQAITAQFSIYPEGESAEYQEQQTLNTDAYGVFHAIIGSVTPVDFAAVDFAAKKYFMKVEVKVSGGDYVEISNTELLSVPYAKAAQTAVSAQTATVANNGNPAGVILPFGGPVGKIPAGYLACDGSSVAVADYPELYDAIGDAWGGDGGTNFNLPDFRGQFLRGQDNGAGVDPDVAARTDIGGTVVGDEVGSYQGDAFRAHAHGFNDAYFSETNGGNRGFAGSNTGLDYDNGPLEYGKATFNAGGNETRPTNAYVLFMIKY